MRLFVRLKLTSRDNVIPLLHQLHWLPVKQYIYFKILTLVFKCQTGETPEHLCNKFNNYDQASHKYNLGSRLNKTLLIELTLNV